jgi:hypothetical protein
MNASFEANLEGRIYNSIGNLDKRHQSNFGRTA